MSLLMDRYRSGARITAADKAAEITDLREIEGWIAQARADGAEEVLAIGVRRRAELQKEGQRR